MIESQGRARVMRGRDASQHPCCRLPTIGCSVLGRPDKVHLHMQLVEIAQCKEVFSARAPPLHGSWV